MRWVGGVLTLFLAVHCATGGGADAGNPGSRPGAGGTSNILLDGGNTNPRSDSGPPVDTTGCGDGVLQPAKGGGLRRRKQQRARRLLGRL